MASSGTSETKAAGVKRVRRDPEVTRGLILDAAERIMVEEGYAAVGSRRIALELELNAATIHYYYPTTDELFIALHRRMTERQLAGLEAVRASDNPLQAFWAFQSGWGRSALGVEFVALANHRKAVGEALAGATEAARRAQGCALERAAGRIPLDPEILSPLAVATLLVAVARTLTNEERVGITCGHAEVRRFMDWALNQLDRS